VDHISDINMPYSHFAYNNLMREGLRKDRTFITGSPMLEVINAHRQQIEDSDILEKLHLEKGKYMVMSAHREENVDIPEKFNRLYPALNKIADEYKMPVIFSVHPRTQKQFDAKGFKLSNISKMINLLDSLNTANFKRMPFASSAIAAL
jgi:UDP-N-acetylglucosamine 2-epimerase